MTIAKHSSKIWNKLHLHKNVDAAFSSCVPLQEVDFCKRQKLIIPYPGEDITPAEEVKE